MIILFLLINETYLFQSGIFKKFREKLGKLRTGKNQEKLRRCILSLKY